MAAIIIVAVVLFVFSRLTGIFRQGSNKPTTETVSMTTEDSTTVVDINTEDQINMPSVLGLPQDMAREKLKESSLVMEVTGSEYSEDVYKRQDWWSVPAAACCPSGSFRWKEKNAWIPQHFSADIPSRRGTCL